MSTPTDPHPFAIAVAVGPDAREIDRLIDLADSVAAFERGPAHFVMVDDSPTPRGLDSKLSLPPSITPVSLHHPRHGSRAVQFKVGKGICSAILLAMGWIQEQTSAAFALKLDTDSLVIGPFRERIAARFAADPELGIIGAYRRTPIDTARDWASHGQKVRAFFSPPPFEMRRPIRSLVRRAEWQRPEMFAVYEAARANGYDHGEHCMGGGYAVSRVLLDRMRSARHFGHVNAWTSVDLPEDVMMGLHCRSTNLTMADDVAPNAGVFGVRYMGLPFSPEELLAKRYAVIHAVKNDERFPERDIRAFFQQHRETHRDPSADPKRLA